MGNIKITTKLSRLKSVSSIDNDYLEAASRDVLKNFVIFTGKRLCWSLFLIKLQACKFIEKRLQHWCFPLHFKKFFRTPILKNIREWLPLIILLVLSNLFVFRCLFTMIKKSDLLVKKMFFEIRLWNQMYIFKDHVKIVQIYMVKFNVSILNGVKNNVFFFINTKYIHKYNVSLYKTVTKLCAILTKCFFFISEPYKLL